MPEEMPMTRCIQSAAKVPRRLILQVEKSLAQAMRMFQTEFFQKQYALLSAG
ncbi:hypothetical protein [Desulfovibrio sp. ZJ369]|uniref:hypothetical protein n=1 Tax=Desulfovibrio sp. ZJ369 TaxID=2709793 RepID=UPI0013EBFA87|nr:hypothetical protein [Desulfovibrio sp. ZJ369]